MAQKRPPSWEMGETHIKPLKPDMDAPAQLISQLSPLPHCWGPGRCRQAEVQCHLGALPFPGQVALTQSQRRRGGVALQIFKLRPD